MEDGAELTQAVKQIAQEVLDARLNPGDISEEMIANYLYTSSLPKDLRDPDPLLTSGELRLSNSCLGKRPMWALLTDVMWPDFWEKACMMQ